MKRAALLLVLSAACGPAEETTAPPVAPKALPVGSVERYFPLEEGRLYNWATTQDGDTGMLVAKVKRTDATHGELRLSNRSDRFVFSPEGVRYDKEGGAFVLKEPLEVGTKWAGEHGGTTRIELLDVNVTVPAGTYSACIKTVEEGGRIQGARYSTTFCPGVGQVLVEITAPGGTAKIELRSYGLPVTID